MDVALMAKSAEDLIAPIGEVEASMFPEAGENNESTVVDRLQSYLDEGYVNLPITEWPDEKVRDKAAMTWAYYRAFRAVYVRLTSEPVQATLLDQGSRLFTNDQAKRMLALSEQYRRQYDEIVVAIPEDPGVVTRTAAVPNRFVF